MNNFFPNQLGVVVIGRNEGERLKNCLQSVQVQARFIAYVDSGSSDGSVEYAISIGVDVVELDMCIPFSAGRARNEGFLWLLKKHPYLKYVQFLDGDCELCDNWLKVAHDYLESNDNYVIVAGRRNEKYPDSSIYNLLCDIEWDTPFGETNACGGDFLARVKGFQQVNGFNPSIIAGEEPELCYRLLKKGWIIFRLNHPMTLHDAAIKHFSQWFKRTVRSGHAYIHRFVIHAHDMKGYCLGKVVKTWFWALLYPLVIFILTFFYSPFFLLLGIAYVIQFLKISIYSHGKHDCLYHTFIYAFFTVLAKWPEFFGQLVFLKRKLLNKDFSIIEYS
jgi:glycosyltransferase involved in cell wall biosynthesis